MNKRIRKKIMKKGFAQVGEFLRQPEIIDLLVKIMRTPNVKWFSLKKKREKQ